MNTAPRRPIRHTILLATLLAAPVAWAGGGMPHPSFPRFYIGANGGSDNVVTVDSTVGSYNSAFGGYSNTEHGPDTSGAASRNTLDIEGGVYDGSFYAGYARVHDGTSTATSTRNILNVNNQQYEAFAYGGLAESLSGAAAATGNAATIKSGGLVKNSYGGAAAVLNAGNATAANNPLTIENGGSVRSDALGGQASTDNDAATATGNTLTVGGSVGSYIYGGSAHVTSDGNATAANNTLAIENGGSAGRDIYGGYANNAGRSGLASATDNTVILNGKAPLAVKVYGGYAHSINGAADASNNTVILGAALGASTLANADLYGGYADSTGSTVSGNTLRVEASGVTVKSLNGFENLNFTMPAGIKGGDVILTTTGNADFSASSSTSINIAVIGAPALKQPNTITLIAAGVPLTITPQLAGSANEYFALTTSGTSTLVAQVKKDLVPLKVSGSTPQGGKVTCEHTEVAKDIGITTCTATADTAAGYTFKEGSMTASSGTISECDGAVCKLSGVSDDVPVTATFSGGSTPTPPTPVPYYYFDDSSPTLGELGLLLSGLALAGAAAPALRRRERKQRKQD